MSEHVCVTDRHMEHERNECIRSEEGIVGKYVKRRIR